MSDRGNSLRERVSRYRTGTVTRVRDLRAQLPAVAVPYEVRMHVPVKPRLLSYWIPFVAGVGLMAAGMKTARVPFVGVAQLVLGVVLIALTSWTILSDSGRLNVRSSPLHPPPRAAPPALPSTRIRKTYDEGFRRHAVHMVRSTGQPIAAIARELDVNPSTLASWVRKDRQDRDRLRIVESDGS